MHEICYTYPDFSFPLFFSAVCSLARSARGLCVCVHTLLFVVILSIFFPTDAGHVEGDDAGDGDHGAMIVGPPAPAPGVVAAPTDPTNATAAEAAAAAAAANAAAAAAGVDAKTANVASASANASAIAAGANSNMLMALEQGVEVEEEEKVREAEDKNGRDWELAHSVAVASLNNLAVLLSEQGGMVLVLVGLGFWSWSRVGCVLGLFFELLRTALCMCCFNSSFCLFVCLWLWLLCGCSGLLV